MNLIRIVTISMLAFRCASVSPLVAQELPTYRVAADKVFVAGISSGAYMAVQMDIAYSATFKGAAIYAGGPDYCAQDSLITALTTCQAIGTTINTPALVAIAESWARQGLIDSLDHLKNQPVYLWSGKLDSTVRQPVMNALQTYYQTLGANVFQYDNSFLAAHGWESPFASEPCAEEAGPYVILCSGADNTAPANPGNIAPYNSEQVWLVRWLGRLNPANQGTLTGQMLPFSQDQFATGENAAAISMGPTGFIYVPSVCAAGAKCGLVLVLHGCNMSYTSIGSAFLNTSGVNQWADTNHLLVLYPQTIASSATGNNPQGCWDWWGYLNDPDYAQKSGPQMQALYGMVMQASGRSRK